VAVGIGLSGGMGKVQGRRRVGCFGDSVLLADDEGNAMIHQKDMATAPPREFWQISFNGSDC